MPDMVKRSSFQIVAEGKLRFLMDRNVSGVAYQQANMSEKCLYTDWLVSLVVFSSLFAHVGPFTEYKWQRHS